MDPTKQPGIRFLGVYLERLDFAVTGEVPRPIPNALSLKISRRVSDDKKSVRVRIDGDLFGNLPLNERPPIQFEFAVAGRFAVTETPNLSLDEFAVDHAPAHLVPYIRELISNITMRSSLPALSIGPLNVKAMVESGSATFEVSESEKEEQQL